MIYRIDIRPRDGNADPLGHSVLHQIRDLGKTIDSVQTTRIFLLDTDADLPAIRKIAHELLADPLVESAEITARHKPTPQNTSRIEVHLKPGVMDPVAA